jgi:hypothetical protein
VVQPPITVSLPCVRQVRCTSIANEVTLASSIVLGTALIRAESVITSTGALTRSKMVPRLTAKASLRWPTKSRAGCVQPGTFTL